MHILIIITDICILVKIHRNTLLDLHFILALALESTLQELAPGADFQYTDSTFGDKMKSKLSSVSFDGISVSIKYKLFLY